MLTPTLPLNIFDKTYLSLKQLWQWLSPSKSLPVPCNPLCLILVIFIFILVGSCTATRPGMTTMLDKKALMISKHMKPLTIMHEKGFEYLGKIYRFKQGIFPYIGPSTRSWSIFRIPFCPRIHKGMPMPPSGLSKRHDLVVDSTHKPCFFTFYGPSAT
jgi:hypothetical protein